MSECWLAIRCVLRSVPLLFFRTPKTPLRVLAIMALDTIHVLRFARPISWKDRRNVALFLDFQSCTNAVWDHKPLHEGEYVVLRARLEAAGLGACVAYYLARLRHLECDRPSAGLGDRNFAEVRT